MTELSENSSRYIYSIVFLCSLKDIEEWSDVCVDLCGFMHNVCVCVFRATTSEPCLRPCGRRGEGIGVLQEQHSLHHGHAH